TPLPLSPIRAICNAVLSAMFLTKRLCSGLREQLRCNLHRPQPCSHQRSLLRRTGPPIAMTYSELNLSYMTYPALDVKSWAQSVFARAEIMRATRGYRRGRARGADDVPVPYPVAALPPAHRS